MSFAGSFNNIPVVRDRLFQGLVGWWRFNSSSGEMADFSGNGNNGTLVGDVVQGMVGQQGDAVYMQGSNDYIEVTTAPVLELEGDLSICCWVWCEVTAGDRTVIAKQFAGASTTAGSYLLYLTRGAIRYGRGNATNTTLQNSDGRISSGKWNHIAISHTGTTARYFINGVFDSQNTIDPAGGYADGGENLLFGTTRSGSRDYNGMMDDMRLYNRGLADDEIMQIYNQKSTNSGLVGDWLLSEAGSQVIDISNFNNNGTVVGATQYYTGIYQIYKALSFDNNNDYVEIPHDYSSLALTQDLSIAAFIRVVDFNDVNCIISKTSGGDAAPFLFNIKSTTGELRLEAGDGATFGAVDSTDTLTAGSWYSVIVTKSGDTVNFYINGNPDSGNPHTLTGYTMVDAGTNVLIGNKDNLVNDFNGQIQSVKLFNRSLNADDVEFIHDAADSIGFYDNLEFWYKMDETSGTNLEDFSLNENDMTITSGVTVNQTGQINGAVLCGGDTTPPVALDSSPTFITIGTGDFACMAWVNTTYTGDRQAIFSLNDSNTLAMYINASAGDSRIEVLIAGIQYNSSNSGNLADGSWHHVAIVRESTGASGLRFYIDGVLNGTATSTESVPAVTAIRLGDDNAGDNEYFDGYIDDLRFYSIEISQGDVVFLAAQ